MLPDMTISFTIVGPTEDMVYEPEISASLESDHIITVNPPHEMYEFPPEGSSYGDIAQHESDYIEYLEGLLSESIYDLEALVRIAIETIGDGKSIQPAIDALRN